LGQVRALRKALKNQRDDLLGFAQVLDEKLDGISAPEDPPPVFSVADSRKQPTSNACKLGTSYTRNCGQFHHLYEMVQRQ